MNKIENKYRKPKIVSEIGCNHKGDIKISINKKNFYKHIKVLFFGSFFILFALIFLFTYYKLLNGSFLESPYNFGNDKFSYVSITNLNLAEVLFSTWHGLLFYHPFYLLSIFFLLII